MDPFQVSSGTSSNSDPYNIPVDTVLAAGRATINTIHPWILLGAISILMFGGIYAGIIAPILSKIFTYFNTGYAHKSRIFTIIFSALVGLGIPTVALLLFFFNNASSHSTSFTSFVGIVWKYLDYWGWDSRLDIPTYLFWYIYGAFFMNLIMCAFFFLFARWTPFPTHVEQTSERHGFIIVAHNSSKKLEKPIRAILKFAQPHQIFIADNGSSVEEMEKTRVLCQSLSTADSSINVGHLRYGNKTLAQYACVSELVERYYTHMSSIDIVTLIDDDVFIPDTFSASSIETQFTDPSKVAIAYPLRIANPDASTYATLQDAEYFTGNVARYIQDLLGSQLFASGAIATWKIHPLKNVLERHCTAFNGEDLEMGYLLHKLCDKTTEKLGVEGSVRIGLERNCCVPTVVPVCLTHWYDFIPAPLKRKCGIKACACGEASFFNQRMRSWDPACHAYFFKFLKIIFSPRGAFYAPKMFIRILCLWKVISLIREYMLVVGIVVSFARLRSVDQLADLATFYLDSMVISWACGVLTTWSQSLSVSRQGLAIRPDIVFSYPVLLELPYGLIIRPISCIYSFCYYLIAQRAPPSLRQQMEQDPEKAEAISQTWKKI